MRYVVDTNIWVFYLKKNQQVRQHLRQALTNQDEICIIPIVYFELLRGLQKRNDLESIELKCCSNELRIPLWAA
jgi:predicted nucleic acid-binding protein